MASSGSGDGTRYIDPDLVYELYINVRSEDLVNYINSFPGAAGDKRCNMIKQLVKSFLPYVITGRGREHMGLYMHQVWADYARELARDCSLAMPRMVGNLTNITSNPVLGHSAMLNQGSATSLRIPAATSTPLQANPNDGHYMNPYDSSSYAGRMPSSYMNPLDSSAYPRRMSGSYMTPFDSSSYSGRMLTSHVSGTGSNVVNDPLAHAAMLNQPSAPNSEIPAATPFPFLANSNDVSNYHPRYAAMLNQTSASNIGFPAPMFLQANSNSAPAPEVGVVSVRPPGPEQFAPQEVVQNTVSPQELPLCQPGSEHFVPQELMQSVQMMSTADSKGKRPASEIIQQEERILRLSVASLIASDCTKGFAGVLITGAEGQFVSASCFPVPSMVPAFVFAAACCEAIKIAQFYQPTAVVLESHLFQLLRYVLQHPELKALKAILRQVPHRISEISEGSNTAARRLALRALQMEVPELFFEIPDWLVN